MAISVLCLSWLSKIIKELKEREFYFPEDLSHMLINISVTDGKLKMSVGKHSLVLLVHYNNFKTSVEFLTEMLTKKAGSFTTTQTLMIWQEVLD